MQWMLKLSPDRSPSNTPPPPSAPPPCARAHTLARARARTHTHTHTHTHIHTHTQTHTRARGRTHTHLVLMTMSHQKIPVIMCEVGQDIALHASATVRNFAFPVCAYSDYSTSFPPPLFKDATSVKQPFTKNK